MCVYVCVCVCMWRACMHACFHTHVYFMLLDVLDISSEVMSDAYVDKNES